MLLSFDTTQNSSQEEYIEPRRLYFYECGKKIPQARQGIWQVYRGIIKLSKLTSSGEEVLLGWVKPHGYLGSYLEQKDVYQSIALSDVYLRWYSIEEIERSPALAYNFVHQQIQRLKQTKTLLVIANLRRVEERLLHLLLFLKEEMSQSSSVGNRLLVRFTHQNMASTIGTTRVTVTRLMGKFQNQGWVLVGSDRHLIIVNLPEQAMRELIFAQS